MKGRKWTAEEKLAIVLEGIKGARAVAEICREHQIAQTQYYQWRDPFLEGASGR
jgi:transposase-like protein